MGEGFLLVALDEPTATLDQTLEAVLKQAKVEESLLETLYQQEVAPMWGEVRLGAGDHPLV